MLAGANWNNGTNSRSQARNANNYRWNTNTNISGRLASDTGFTILSKLPAGLTNPAPNYMEQNTQRSAWLSSNLGEVFTGSAYFPSGTSGES